jgi:hypothetical protein
MTEAGKGSNSLRASHGLDLSAVNSLPLEELTCTADIALRNAPVLRGMKTLKTINGQPAAKYLDSVIAKAKSRPVNRK